MYAEDVNYWQTSKIGPAAWLVKAKKEIVRAGGQVVGSVTVSDDRTGQAGFMLAFEIGPDRFKLTWPVLKAKQGSGSAARIQAATALYHEVKAACVKAKFLGARSAFLAYLLLPDGQTVLESSDATLSASLPQMLLEKPTAAEFGQDEWKGK